MLAAADAGAGDVVVVLDFDPILEGLADGDGGPDGADFPIVTPAQGPQRGVFEHQLDALLVAALDLVFQENFLDGEIVERIEADQHGRAGGDHLLLAVGIRDADDRRFVRQQVDAIDRVVARLEAVAVEQVNREAREIVGRDRNLRQRLQRRAARDGRRDFVRNADQSHNRGFQGFVARGLHLQPAARQQHQVARGTLHRPELRVVGINLLALDRRERRAIHDRDLGAAAAAIVEAHGVAEGLLHVLEGAAETRAVGRVDLHRILDGAADRVARDQRARVGDDALGERLKIDRVAAADFQIAGGPDHAGLARHHGLLREQRAEQQIPRHILALDEQEHAGPDEHRAPQQQPAEPLGPHDLGEINRLRERLGLLDQPPHQRDRRVGRERVGTRQLQRRDQPAAKFRLPLLDK